MTNKFWLLLVMSFNSSYRYLKMIRFINGDGNYYYVILDVFLPSIKG
jgi:hypothetical protein